LALCPLIEPDRVEEADDDGINRQRAIYPIVCADTGSIS
jgi:hypothetical protein